METNSNNDLPGFTFYKVPNLIREYPGGSKERIYTVSPHYCRELTTMTKRQCVRLASRMGHRAVFVG